MEHIYYTAGPSVYNFVLATVLTLGILILSVLIVGFIWREIKIKYKIRTTIRIVLKKHTGVFDMRYDKHYFAVEGLTDWTIVVSKNVRVQRLVLNTIPRGDTVNIFNHGVIGYEEPTV